MSKKFTEKDVSLHTQAEMTDCMYWKTKEEKEKLAKQLIEIVSTSTTEEEMIAKARELHKKAQIRFTKPFKK